MTEPRRLPRGRYALSRAEVESIHRARLCAAMAEVMAEKGYVGTSVGDVLKRAVVSRQSFYQLFDSKLDCFMATARLASEYLMERLREVLAASPEGEEPLVRFERALAAYLDVLAAELPFARLFMVEVYAAGPEAVRRRTEGQIALTRALAEVMEVTDEVGHYTCQVVVAATSALVTPAVASGDRDALRAAAPPLTDHVRRLWEIGAFGAI
ncbi:TetR/AcrR family transcriptional regulator [Actinomadura fulvescens]|uniref:HTH tetR-type domain-containing protein n=1 Tax=Actinomadura fulvescens TaxID=46160 RepID=A0ABP6C8H4_9ACTN